MPGATQEAGTASAARIGAFPCYDRRPLSPLLGRPTKRPAYWNATVDGVVEVEGAGTKREALERAAKIAARIA